jgi:hypothetical protein
LPDEQMLDKIYNSTFSLTMPRSSGRWQLGLALLLLTLCLWVILSIALTMILQVLDVYTVICCSCSGSFGLLAAYLGIQGKLSKLGQLHFNYEQLLAINYTNSINGYDISAGVKCEATPPLSSHLWHYFGNLA